MSTLELVDVETARNASGLRLVILGGGPSPWSQAAKSIFEWKRIPALLVHANIKDEAVRNWTGISNAPVAMYEKEMPRSGWAEILALAERLRPELPLVPSDARERILHYGWSHEILGEGGLMWNFRLFSVDASLESHGELNFPMQVARFLARRYGHTPGCAAPARARIVEILALFDAQLKSSQAAGRRYFFGDRLTAFDIHVACAMNVFAPLPAEQCPAHPVLLSTYAWTQRQLGDAIPQSLVEHRDHIYATHLRLPLQF